MICLECLIVVLRRGGGNWRWYGLERKGVGIWAERGKIWRKMEELGITCSTSKNPFPSAAFPFSEKFLFNIISVFPINFPRCMRQEKSFLLLLLPFVHLLLLPLKWKNMFILLLFSSFLGKENLFSQKPMNFQPKWKWIFEKF